jgi:hypothetical protein
MNNKHSKAVVNTLLALSLLLAGSAFADPLVDLQILNAAGGSGEINVVSGEDVEVSFDVTLDSGGVLDKKDTLELVDLLDESVASSKQRGNGTSGSVTLSVPTGIVAGQFYVRYVREDNGTLVTRVSHPDDEGSVPLVAIEESSLAEITTRVAALEATDPVPGLQGDPGPQGIQGDPGIQGPVGPMGLPGLNGADGAIGPQGPQGIAGNDGATGPQGPQGVPGNDGADGLPGADGAQGPQGVAGEPGFATQRVLYVTANGLSEIDNGNTLLLATQQAAALNPLPSVTNPATILLEPGTYDIGLSTLNLPSGVSLIGFSRTNTSILLDSTVVVRNASVESLTISSRSTGQVTLRGAGTDIRLKDVLIEGRWGVGSTASLEISDSVIDVLFKCLDFHNLNTIADGLTCRAGTFYDMNHSGTVDISLKNSDIQGGLIIRDNGGPAVNITMDNTKFVGVINPSNAGPTPTQPVTVQLYNSQVGGLVVPSPASDVRVTFSDIGTFDQSNGVAFVSHSIVDNLVVTGGDSTIVNTQIVNRSLTGGQVECPFSYDGSFMQLSAMGGEFCPQ